MTNDFPADVILAVATKKKRDLILMASHGRRGLAGVLLGSETRKALTHSQNPVPVSRWLGGTARVRRATGSPSRTATCRHSRRIWQFNKRPACKYRPLFVWFAYCRSRRPDMTPVRMGP